MHPPLRVEQALRLLPDVDALAPLRGFLVASSQARPVIDPHTTVGKRLVHLAELAAFVPEAIEAVTTHQTALYEAAVAALESEQAGDVQGVVRAMLPAGMLEERAGHLAAARVWYDHALKVAEGLRDRRPEIETLRHLGHLESSRGQLDLAARLYQRSFALADAELDQAGAAIACQGLGDVAQAQARWLGAESWYRRGLGFATDNAECGGHLRLGLGVVARGRGLLDEAAVELTEARRLFAEAGDVEGGIRVASAWGLVEGDRGHRPEAVACWRAALVELYRIGGATRLETAIRLNMCRLYLDWDHLAECEDELRRAEGLAIAHNAADQLARLYLYFGMLRGKQNDETGFVFFEKAIELCRGVSPMPRLEAEAYREYARFRNGMGERDEALAYLERIREILESFGDPVPQEPVEAELEQLG